MKNPIPSCWSFVLPLALVLFVLTGCTVDSGDTGAVGPEELEALGEVAEGASDLLPLPSFTDCASAEHPIMPARWQATALMQDFVRPKLTFGNFVYDDVVGAFRFRLVTQDGADVDFLVTRDRRLYMLHGGEEPTDCRFVMNDSPLTMPLEDWLDPRAVCVGEAPILERDLAWWKTPSGQGANWIWYGTENALPFRTMYYADASPDTPVPVYEHFTFNYFPTFEEVPSTNLGRILQRCEQAVEAPVDLRGFDPWEPDAIASGEVAATLGPEVLDPIQSWIPGFRQCGSSQPLPPPWPERVQGTVFMTAVSFEPNPFPTRVYYDWTRPAQNTSLYYYPSDPKQYVQVALLTGNTGYIRIEDEQGGVTMCEQALPGPQVPNWKEVDGCQCRGLLMPNTVLNPSTQVTQVLWCPTDLSADQVFWTWYGNDGTPVVFMQTNSSPTDGTGLNLADYYEWEPGSIAPRGTFDLPSACQGEPVVQVPQACHNCHLPLNAEG